MPSHTDPLFDRAAGCLMGQIAGDSLGGLVEFCSPATIRERYPDGPRLLEDGGTWNILAGQPTDDSEMALMLARLLAEAVEYDAEEARRRYLFWLESGPFDMGRTIALGLRGHPDPDSQANGALMRVSPLGIFGATRHWHDVARWAQQDAALTHAHPVCQQANALYACLIAQAIRSGDSPQDLYAWLLRLARRQRLEPCLYDILEQAPHEAPADYVHKMGWVRIALHNALWQLLHAPTLEEGVVDTVRRGGDTDTNAAICGALLGAGPVGLCAMQCARLFGPAQVIAVDILPSRLQLAQERGYADLTIDAAADDVEARILDATGGLGADAVIECAGGHDTFQTAWKVARPNATVAVVAMYEEAQSLPLHLMYGKNLTFRTGGVDATHSAELIRLIERGRIDTNPLITHSLPLNKILEGYRIFEQRQDDCIKCAITPWKR